MEGKNILGPAGADWREQNEGKYEGVKLADQGEYDLSKPAKGVESGSHTEGPANFQNVLKAGSAQIEQAREDFTKRLDAALRADETEEKIQAKGLTAPRITPQDVENNIASEHYFTGLEGAIGHEMLTKSLGEAPAFIKNAESLKVLTFCVLVLQNGFTVFGHSAPASISNFDADLGRFIARKAALEKVWPLMGYALRTQLALEALPPGPSPSDPNIR